MSREYRQKTELAYKRSSRNLVQEMPSYLKDYFRYISNSKEASTQNRYIRDIIAFLQYEHDVVPELRDLAMKDLPVELFDQLTIQDLFDYQEYLEKKSGSPLSASTLKKTMASLSSFYRFLNISEYTKNNPVNSLDPVKVNKKHIIKLDAELSNRLLTGILRNDKYLDIPASSKIEFTDEDFKKLSAKTLEEMKEPVPITQMIRTRREKVVLRNFAITALFLGAGLRVSELVGLDLSDVNFKNNSLSIIKKGGDDTEVYFNEDVAEILWAYIYSSPLPVSLLIKYYPDRQKLISWCEENQKDLLYKPDMKDEDLEQSGFVPAEIREMIGIMNYPGRKDLENPKKPDQAVFLSSRGTRMTVRMVELMIKEMVRTYLPDYIDKDLFSPHKLRATCATRILTQTGDIQMAATQLNHKGIAVTSAAYAELAKERQKDRIRSLEMNEW